MAFEKNNMELVEVRIAMDPYGDDDPVVWLKSEGRLDALEVSDLNKVLSRVKLDWIDQGRTMDPDLLVLDALKAFAELHGPKLSLARMPVVSHLYI